MGLSVGVLLVAGGCGSQGDAEGSSGPRATEIVEAVHAGGTRLDFKIGCASDVEVKLLEERADAVVLSATQVPHPDGIYPACLIPYFVELQAPLGDRLLLDQEGDVIEVKQLTELPPLGETREAERP